jgi:hypothetical protein
MFSYPAHNISVKRAGDYADDEQGAGGIGQKAFEYFHGVAPFVCLLSICKQY